MKKIVLVLILALVTAAGVFTQESYNLKEGMVVLYDKPNQLSNQIYSIISNRPNTVDEGVEALFKFWKISYEWEIPMGPNNSLAAEVLVLEQTAPIYYEQFPYNLTFVVRNDAVWNKKQSYNVYSYDGTNVRFGMVRQK
jgi:hypothetical protein